MRPFNAARWHLSKRNSTATALSRLPAPAAENTGVASTMLNGLWKVRVVTTAARPVMMIHIFRRVPSGRQPLTRRRAVSPLRTRAPGDIRQVVNDHIEELWPSIWRNLKETDPSAVCRLRAPGRGTQSGVAQAKPALASVRSDAAPADVESRWWWSQDIAQPPVGWAAGKLPHDAASPGIRPPARGVTCRILRQQMVTCR